MQNISKCKNEFILILCYYCDIIICNRIICVFMGELNMNINKISDNNMLTIELEGRLDTVSAPQLEAELKKSLSGVEILIFDFEKLEYLSSAGLRVLLSSQKVMNRQGQMKIKNVNSTITDIFEVTGFSEILTVEQ